MRANPRLGVATRIANDRIAALLPCDSPLDAIGAGYGVTAWLVAARP